MLLWRSRVAFELFVRNSLIKPLTREDHRRLKTRRALTKLRLKRGLVCLNGGRHGVAVPLPTSELARQLESLRVPFCCDVIVAGLRAQAILLTESEAVVHELTVTTKIEHVRVHELLLAQKRKVAGGASCGGGDR